MRRYVFSFALIATAVLGPSMALGNDQQIAQTIVERLQAQKKAGNLKGFSLDLQVESGEVWLTGRVSSDEQQALALDIARRVPGVKQVVNDITVEQDRTAQGKLGASRNMFASIGSKVRQAVGQDDQAAGEPDAIGTGVEGGNAYYAGAAAAPAPIPAPAVAAPLPQQLAGPMPQYYARPNMPMAYAPARTIAHQNPDVAIAGPANGVGGQPMPMHVPGSAIGMAPARYDHPHMPGYAWPSYASYPNYAAVTYPKQYSPTAWPYIGPFYPYPQVPLGWRKVTLEWDDGWWMLDFKDRRH